MYDPDSFSKFCISAGATKIFDTLVVSLVLGTQKTAYALQKKRLLHIFTIFAILSRRTMLFISGVITKIKTALKQN